AEKYQISREEQDVFAANSQQKALAAIDAGRFESEILPIAIPQKKREPIIFSQDQGPRRGTTAEVLARLAPAFKEGGTVTAGNASGLNDGAAAVAVCSREFAEKSGLTPLVRIKA